jgi:HEAT repeat protein
MNLMNSNDQTTSVNASNKVSEMYGSDGLLRVLREGQSTARSKAARWLWRFPGDEVERSLIEIVEREKDDFLRIQALYSLEEIGTERAVPALEIATHDRDERVAAKARDAMAAIRSRVRVRQ